MCASACRSDAPAINYLLADLGRLDYHDYGSVGIAEQAIAGEVATLRTAGRLIRQPAKATAGKHIKGVAIVAPHFRRAD